MNLALILCLGRTLAQTLLFPYSNSCLARILSQETSASFGNDFVDIYVHVANYVRLMLEKQDEFADMNDKNEGKAFKGLK